VVGLEELLRLQRRAVVTARDGDRRGLLARHLQREARTREEARARRERAREHGLEPLGHGLERRHLDPLRRADHQRIGADRRRRPPPGGGAGAAASATLGPERKHARAASEPGSTASSTSAMVWSVDTSIPFDALTTIASGRIAGAASVMTRRTCCDGVTETTTSASDTASSRRWVASSPGCSVTPGRYRGFSRVAVIASAMSCS